MDNSVVYLKFPLLISLTSLLLFSCGGGGGSNTPPTADISITKTTSIAPGALVTIGESYTYKISVENIGPDAATNVIVEDTLPAGMALVSATASNQGSCNQTGTISCDLGTMRQGLVNTIDIVVETTTSVTVSVNNTATVSSSVFDSNTANNSSTVSTLIGVNPTAVIQSLIDAAFPGDTVQIDPGTYIGGLDFKGKDITLKATGGPTDTVIHGNDSWAIRIGPGGSIQGFTITGAKASFGAAIDVSGTGTLISGNIFDGNAQEAGGYGAAIGGNNASPTVAGNIFRNNSCDNQFLSSVVGFVNGSSPVIVNNIFEDNPCRGINMSLPTGNTPQVINNTLVNNRVGIRVSRQVNVNTQIYRNNIIFKNEIGLEVDFGTEPNNPIWENNLVFDNSSNNYLGISDQFGINGNIASDPIFVDFKAGNYQLQIGSPAIDRGNSLDAPAIDFDGTARPLDGDGMVGPQIDIGAFESPAL